MTKRVHNKALVYFRRIIRLVLAMVVLLSLSMIAIGMLLPQDSVPWRVLLKTILVQTGTTVLLAGTLGVFLTEAYSQLRELTIRDEILRMVDKMRELVNKPEQFRTFQLLANMEEAGLLAFYPNRLGPAQDDLHSRIRGLLEEHRTTTVCIIGDTLRVFFSAESPFTSVVHKVLSRNPSVTLRVLLLNPNCRLALLRSEAESINAPFKDDEEYRRSGLFQDSGSSCERIREWNNNLTSLRNGSVPVEVKLYGCADYCLAVIFPDVCYTAQYIYSDADAQVQTSGIPMLKYSKDSVTYQRLRWNFDWIWRNHSISYEDYRKSLQDRPIVRCSKNDHQEVNHVA
jgi:hypothetical protein